MFFGFPNFAARRLGCAVISTNVIIAALAYLYIIRAVKRRDFSEICNRYVFIAALMLIPIFLSALNAYEVKLGLLYFRNYISFVLLAILVPWRLKKSEDILRFLRIFSLVGFGLVIITFLFGDVAYIMSYLHSYKGGGIHGISYRLVVLEINTATLGYYFAVLFMINISLLQRKSKWNIFLIILAAIDTFFVLLSFSRGVFLVFITEIFVYFSLRFKLSKACQYSFAIAVFAYIALNKYFKTCLARFCTLLAVFSGMDVVEKVFPKRVNSLAESFHVGMQHFFFGVGGYNLNVFSKYGTHNQFLNMFSENGIFTFVLYLLFVVLVIVSLLSLSRRLRNKFWSCYDRKISVCLASIMCGSFVEGIVSYLRFDFWVLCGVSIAWIAIVNKQKTARCFL